MFDYSVSLHGPIWSERFRVPVAQAAARGISVMLRRYWRARNSRPGREGWPKSDYWADVADSVTTSVEGEEAVVTAEKEGLALRLYGGIVRPKTVKRLAIPIDPLVAGIWPREYTQANKLFALEVKKDESRAVLGRKEADGSFRPLWLLLSSTNHKADPSVMPSDETITGAAKSAAEMALRELAK